MAAFEPVVSVATCPVQHLKSRLQLGKDCTLLGRAYQCLCLNEPQARH